MLDAATAISATALSARLPPISACPTHRPQASTIAIIGAGFSGTLLAIHLLRRCPLGTRVVLIERSHLHGTGLAYSTQHQGHLLNVPAEKMSAFPDQPLDFLHWLQLRAPEELDGVQPAAGAFVPRGLYGAYIRSHLQQVLMDPATREHLALVQDDVTGLDRTVHPLRLHLKRGEPIEADIAVLAVGNLPPCPIQAGDGSFYDTPFYRHDPWASDVLTGLHPEAPVLLMGAGLTMVDTAMALLDQGHRGPIHTVSRRGMLPHRHQAAPPAPEIPAPYPARLTALTRMLRAQAKAAHAAGGDWRAVVDALRPFTTDLWQALPTEDKARFLRHLRPWWDIHRHRMAGPAADRIAAAVDAGQLRIHAGRLQRFAVANGMADVTLRPRNGDVPLTLTAARVINCTGPGIECGRLTDTLLLGLLRDGTVRTDALGLGLDVTPNAALRAADGSVSRRLFAVGPMTRAAFWEMTAVPDIRRQAETLALHLSALVKPPAPAPSVPAPRGPAPAGPAPRGPAPAGPIAH